MKIIYFAWIREKTGVGEEDLALPGGVADVGALIAWIAARGNGFAEAFNDPALVRVAVNQEHVTLDHPVGDGDEVAFFPPVTGG